MGAFHVSVIDGATRNVVAEITCTDKRDARVEADRWAGRGYRVLRDFDFRRSS